MNNKTKVGIGVVLGALVGIGVGIATHNIGEWVGIGVVIGAVIGLATRIR
jgi:galactitol-specific phosphotransferase system IIC component